MKILSSASFNKISPLINENYGNLHGRLRMKLNQEESELFAFPDFPVANMGNWQTSVNAPLQTFKDAPAIEKEEIATFIEEKKQSILSKIGSSMPFANLLFRVPSEDQIFWYRDDKGQVKVILSQWGFQPVTIGKDVDVIDVILSLPRPLTQVPVKLHISYSDGDPAGEEEFALTVFNHTQTIKTDENGCYSLGKMYASKTFSVADAEGTSFDFTVEANKSDYYVSFDIKTNYTITVINQFEEKVTNYTLRVDDKAFVTNEEGQVKGEGVLLTKGRTLKVAGQNAAQQEYPLVRNAEANEFVFKILVEVTTGYSVKVIDQHDIIKTGYPLNINGNTIETNEEGKVVAQNVPWTDGQTITVGSSDGSVQTFTISKDAESNNFVYRVTIAPPVEKMVRVKILDYDGSVLPGIEVFIDTKNHGTISAFTDEEGFATFKAADFTEGEKSKVHFVVSKEYRDKRNAEKNKK